MRTAARRCPGIRSSLARASLVCDGSCTRTSTSPLTTSYALRGRTARTSVTPTSSDDPDIFLDGYETGDNSNYRFVLSRLEAWNWSSRSPIFLDEHLPVGRLYIHTTHTAVGHHIQSYQTTRSLVRSLASPLQSTCGVVARHEPNALLCTVAQPAYSAYDTEFTADCDRLLGMAFRWKPGI